VLNHGEVLLRAAQPQEEGWRAVDGAVERAFNGKLKNE
jgi:hypothetical protein